MSHDLNTADGIVQELRECAKMSRTGSHTPAGLEKRTAEAVFAALGLHFTLLERMVNLLDSIDSRLVTLELEAEKEGR